MVCSVRSGLLQLLAGVVHTLFLTGQYANPAVELPLHGARKCLKETSSVTAWQFALDVQLGMGGSRTLSHSPGLQRCILSHRSAASPFTSMPRQGPLL